MADGKVAVVTGANSGIGLALSERLLAEQTTLHLCLACRNKARAEAAKQKLLRLHPEADITVVLIDTSCIKSVLQAASEIKSKYKRLDYIYLNAGILQVSSINWDRVLAILSRDGLHILRTGKGALNVEDEKTEEGLQKVFATNLFGHYVLIRELVDRCGGEQPTQIIWTGSSNADQGDLDLGDIQTVKGKEPYAAVKYATDVVSVALNDELNTKRIYSHTTCPGLVCTNVTYGILPSWIWMILLPFLYLMRLFVSSLTLNTYCGSEALLWLSKQKPESLDPRCKYHSSVSVLGKRYISTEKLSITSREVEGVSHELEKLYQQFQHKYRKQENIKGSL